MNMRLVSIVTSLICICSLPASGKTDEQKNIYHNIFAGGGLSWEWNNPAWKAADIGITYGLEIGLKNNWYVMPGVSCSALLDIGQDKVSAVPFINLFCQARRCFALGNGLPLIAGLGPSASFMGYGDTTDDVQVVVPKSFYPFQLGLTGSLDMILGEKWVIGLYLNIGALQLMVPDNIVLNSSGIHIGIRF